MPDDTVLDGEVVAIDESGRPSFNLLQNFSSAAVTSVYYVFDVLVLNGRDLMSEPLSSRAELLESEVLPTLTEPVRHAPAFDAPLSSLIESVRAQGLEGLVATLARPMPVDNCSNLVLGTPVEWGAERPPGLAIPRRLPQSSLRSSNNKVMVRQQYAIYLFKRRSLVIRWDPSMKKIELVAHCLVSSKTVQRTDDATSRVRHVFLEEFPHGDFGAWNSQINDLRASQVIAMFGKGSMVNVKRMIELLW